MPNLKKVELQQIILESSMQYVGICAKSLGHHSEYMSLFYGRYCIPSSIDGE